MSGTPTSTADDQAEYRDIREVLQRLDAVWRDAETLGDAYPHIGYPYIEMVDAVVGSSSGWIIVFCDRMVVWSEVPITPCG